jgi:hypothetical protein
MLKQSEGWIYSFIRLLATSSYTLWDSRNQSRHGTDALTKAQLLQMLKGNWVDALEQEIHYAHDPDTTDAERIQGIIESKYTPADLFKIVEECTLRKVRTETLTKTATKV